MTPMNNLCAACGKPMNSDAKFCAECGTVAVTPPATLEAMSQPGAAVPGFGASLLNPAPPKRKRSLVAVVLVTVSLGWAAYSGVQGYRNAGQETKATSTTNRSAPPVRDTDSPAVGTVRNGTFPEYQATTIGKAFEGTFQNPQWRSFTGPKGENVVEFTGAITGLSITKCGYPLPQQDNCRAELKALEKEKEKWSQSAGAGLVKFEDSYKATHSKWDNPDNDPAYRAMSRAVADKSHEFDARETTLLQGTVMKCEESTPIPVKFQFLISAADPSHFQLTFGEMQGVTLTDKGLDNALREIIYR
jgi:hypothetical protein